MPSHQIECRDRIFDGTVPDSTAARLDGLPQMLLYARTQETKHNSENNIVATHRSLSALRMGGPILCGNTIAVSTHR